MPIENFRSLSFKLTVWYIVILGIIVTLAGVFLYQGFKESLIDGLDEDLMEIADKTNETWRRERGVDWEEAIRRAEQKFITKKPFIQVVGIADEKPRRILSVIHTETVPEGGFLLDTRVYYQADRSDINSLVFRTVTCPDLGPFPIRVFFLPVRGDNVLQVGISMESTLAQLRRLLIVMILAGVLLLVFASLGGSFIINRALHPVKSVARTAAEISADDLSLRIKDSGRKDEIGVLVRTFNDMIARLEKSVDKIRQFSGDVSHELRTPLTIIRGEIEVLLRKERGKEDYVRTLESVLEESRRMEKIIDDLLFLSRVEAMDRSRLNQDVRLDEVLARVVESRKPVLREKSLDCTLEIQDGVVVRGSAELLERMAVNLVDNAVRYTPAGGRIHAAVSRETGAVVLEIRDTGIGIPEESLPHIFDRFFVADKSRSKETGGSGLGLSIVKWIAEIHGARVEVQSREGEGSSFRILFPAR